MKALRTNISPGEEDFRSLLQAELLRRCRANPRYSLRSFARYLAIEPSALSKLLHGKRGVSPRMLRHLGAQLGLSPVHMSHYLATRRQMPSASDYQSLTLDTFEVIADWCHYAILELTLVQGFRPEPKWIARALGLSVTEVKLAVERLVRLGFLEIAPDGQWKDCSGAITTVGNEFTATAFRRLQRQVLEKALRALEETPMAQRDQSSMTMAANSRLLPEAKKKIKNFRRRLCVFLKSQPPLDQVYQLSISLYPLMPGSVPKGDDS